MPVSLHSLFICLQEQWFTFLLFLAILICWIVAMKDTPLFICLIYNKCFFIVAFFVGIGHGGSGNKIPRNRFLRCFFARNDWKKYKPTMRTKKTMMTTLLLFTWIDGSVTWGLWPAYCARPMTKRVSQLELRLHKKRSFGPPFGLPYWIIHGRLKGNAIPCFQYIVNFLKTEQFFKI